MLRDVLDRLTPPVIGVDVGARWVSMAQLGASDGDARVVRFRRASDDEPMDEVFARVAEAALRQGFRGTRVALAARGPALRTSLVEVGRDVGEDTAGHVWGEFARMHGLEEEPFTVAAWNVSSGRRGATTELLAVGTDDASVEAVLDAAEGAGLDPCAVDGRPLALVRGLRRSVEPTDDGLEAVVDLAWDESSLVLVRGDTVVYQRSMGCGGLLRIAARLTESGVDDTAQRFVWSRDRGQWDALRGTPPYRQMAGLAAEHAAGVDADLRAAEGYAGQQFGAGIARCWVTGEGVVLPGLMNELETRHDRVQPLGGALSWSDAEALAAIGLSAWREREAA